MKQLFRYFSLGLSLLCNLSLSASIPQYIEIWEGQNEPFQLIRDNLYGQGDYLHSNFLQFIDKNQLKFILEVGSRDAIDALDLSHFYQAHVCAFECNPRALIICHHNCNQNPNITVVPLAAWNETKPITFYPIIESDKPFNLGASSLYKFDSHSPDFYKQEEIIVQTVRLDEWLNAHQYDTPDLICIDAQGATLPILQGLGNRLSQVKYIIAEVEFVRFYDGEALYPEISTFLKQHGFKEVTQLSNSLFANILFIREN